MFRIIKRSPWIALGAAGAWLFDPIQGPQRRTMVTTKARQWTSELKSSRPSTTSVNEPFSSSATTSTPTTSTTSEYTDPALRSA